MNDGKAVMGDSDGGGVPLVPRPGPMNAQTAGLTPKSGQKIAFMGHYVTSNGFRPGGMATLDGPWPQGQRH